jgi:hypothetical protein
MQFELLSAVIITSGIVERNPALPIVGRLRRIELNSAIEIVQRLLYMPHLEMLRAPAIVSFGADMVLRQQQACNEKPGEYASK